VSLILIVCFQYLILSLVINFACIYNAVLLVSIQKKNWIEFRYYHYYFDPNSALGLALNSLLLDKLSSHGLFAGYVKSVCSYLTKRPCDVNFSGEFSSPLRCPVFPKFMFCSKIIHTFFVIFVDNVIIFVLLPLLMTVLFVVRYKPCKIVVTQTIWKLMLTFAPEK
jgi:hypothetical protein